MNHCCAALQAMDGKVRAMPIRRAAARDSGAPVRTLSHNTTGALSQPSHFETVRGALPCVQGLCTLTPLSQ